ncbi:MAG: type I pullulanase [Prevotella sp.]|nr:type I pullulanase [Prevotella sp.]
MKKNIILIVMLAMTAMVQAQTPDFVFDEVTYTPDKTTFKLFAPCDAKSVKVEYDVNPDTAAVSKWKAVKMKIGKDGIWKAVVKRDLNHHEYRFYVDGQYSPGVFAKAVGVNGQLGYVLNLSETNPVGWAYDHRPEVKSPTDLVIYEMHHRDFSIDPSSGIMPEHRGKFLALTEPKAIQHLKDLGVNAIHILPSYDFGSIDETRLQDKKYNWGYDPVNYNVPEGSYSTDPFDPACRIREFKQMVQALHKAGIRVILDVVYNHTYDIDHSNFQRTYPDYFYRKVSPSPNPSPLTPQYSNGSGCGNETASEQPMMRRFMIESVKYWINEYHIDGFRFDLMGVHDIETMNAIRQAVDAIDPTIFIYGEGWSAGACALPAEQLATKAHIPQLPRIAAFSDDIRDALRGPFSDDTKGAFLAGIAGEEESLKAGIAGMIAHPQVDYAKVNYSDEPWAVQPTQMISYVSCHDDMCLVDRLRTSIPGITTDELIRLDLLAQTAVFTSQGVPFMLSGEEMLRDKKGVHNSFESPDSVNHLDWDNLTRYPQVFEYYRNLIALRAHHPAFRLGDADLVRRHLEFLPTQDCMVAFRLKDHAGGDAWKDIIVILNGNKYLQMLNIPEGRYTIVACDGQIDEQGLGFVEGHEVGVSARSALILKR